MIVKPTEPLMARKETVMGSLNIVAGQPPKQQTISDRLAQLVRDNGDSLSHSYLQTDRRRRSEWFDVECKAAILAIESAVKEIRFSEKSA